MALLQKLYMVFLKYTTFNTYQLTLNCALTFHVPKIYEHVHPNHVAKHQSGMHFPILILGRPLYKFEWKRISILLLLPQSRRT